MQVLLAVLRDLWTFACNRGTAALPGVARLELPSPPSPQTLPPAAPVSGRSESRAVVAAAMTQLRTEPAVAFDNTVARISYGTPLTLGEVSGRFQHASCAAGTGWVLRDDVGSEHDCFPTLKVGYRYDAADAATQRIRLAIADTFNAAETSEPLTGAEYVTYRLGRAGRTLPWPMRAGRVPGSWQRKLRGVRGVHLDVAPHTGAVMEYIIDDVGYLCYVEAVAPNQAIRVSAVGLFAEGQYSEEVLSREVWRERQPVFISVT